MKQELIEITRLEKSPLNARKTETKAAADDLKASILAHGLMQNLVVIPAKKDRYHVIAGARRLAALHALQAEGKLPADHSVPCQIVDENAALEMSVAENVIRAAMHPADEFEAFSALADKGQSAEMIATNFGTTAKHVMQRLKLGRVAPEILADYRAGEIDLECLEAFTITDDRKRQLAVYRSLSGWQKGNARHIRGCLTERMTEADDKLAKFVGLDAYRAAGGTVRADLFGDDVYLEDSALLQRLAGERLNAEAEKVRTEGWGWVEVDFECSYSTLSKFGRIEPVPLNAPDGLQAELREAESEQTRIAEQIDAAYEAEEEDEDLIERLESEQAAIEERIDRIESELEDFIDFDPEQKKQAGCFLSVNYGGKLSVDKGLVKPEAKKQLVASSGEATGLDPEPEKAVSFPQSLIDDLKAYRLGAAQAEIARHPAIAFDLLVFKAAKAVCGLNHAYDGPQVSFQGSRGGMVSREAREFIAAIVGEVKGTLSLDWLGLDNEADQFAALQTLSGEQKHAILAYCVASMLQPKLACPDDCPTAYDIALGQTGADMASYWRPNATNFLSRIKTGQLLEIGSELLGEAWAAQRRNAKKSALVAELDKAFAEPQRALDPDKVRKIASWLPERMEFGGIAAGASVAA